MKKKKHRRRIRQARRLIPIAVAAYCLGARCYRLRKLKDLDASARPKETALVARRDTIGQISAVGLWGTVLTSQDFRGRWSVRRLVGRPPRVIAIFSFRYDAHLVPGLIENLRPTVDGFVAYDDRGATVPYTDERTRRAVLRQAARDLGAEWVLCVDPDERLEGAAAARMADLTSGIDPAVWIFRLRELYEPLAYRVDGIWDRKRIGCLFPLLEGQVFSDKLLHGQRHPINPDYQKRDSKLNIYHLKMITPERRVARRSLYTSLDPGNAYQKIGYDYLADDRGLKLKRVSSARGYLPVHYEAGGVWQAPLESIATAELQNGAAVPSGGGHTVQALRQASLALVPHEPKPMRITRSSKSR